MHWRDLLVDDKVVKVTMSKNKYDYIGTLLKAKMLLDLINCQIRCNT